MPQPTEPQLKPDAYEVYKLLCSGEYTVDQIAFSCKLAPKQVSGILAHLRNLRLIEQKIHFTAIKKTS